MGEAIETWLRCRTILIDLRGIIVYVTGGSDAFRQEGVRHRLAWPGAAEQWKAADAARASLSWYFLRRS